MTIFLTTHYMDEAEHCDRIAIIDHGQIAALDTPDALKRGVGGDIIRLRAANNAMLIQELKERHDIDARMEDDEVTFTVMGGKEWLPRFVREPSSRCCR